MFGQGGLDGVSDPDKNGPGLLGFLTAEARGGEVYPRGSKILNAIAIHIQKSHDQPSNPRVLLKDRPPNRGNTVRERK